MMNNIVIERYPDRLVFTNPGTMLISVDQFFKGGKSICRNFTLQKMFSFIGFVERAGSGADTIIKGWEENKWPRPQIHEMYDPDMVEMVLLFNERHAEKTREKILQLLQDVPQITTAEIAEKNRDHHQRSGMATRQTVLRETYPPRWPRQWRTLGSYLYRT